MQDDKKSLEEETDFDDLDFDDIDENDDFEEEWDDFDEESGGAPSGDMNADSVEGQGASTAQKEKSFLQKNFNMIVITLAVLGGGGFMYTQFAGSPAQQNSTLPTPDNTASADMSGDFDQQPVDEISELQTDLPPMPAPFEGTADTALVEENIVDEPDIDLNITSEETLTPLPDFSKKDEADLSDLFALEETAEVLEEEIQEEPALIFDNEPAIAEAPPQAVIEETSLPETEQLSIEEAIGDISELQEQPELEALETAKEENQQIIEEAVETEKRMAKELSDANNQIQTLNSTIKALEAKIVDLETQADKAPQPPAAEKDPAPMPAEKPEKQTQKAPESAESAETSKSPISTSKTRENIQNIKWILRSAQPGQATIARKDKKGQATDFRNVETGDNVEGLGKIKSIALENNLWVVHGTKGRVSQ